MKFSRRGFLLLFSAFTANSVFAARERPTQPNTDPVNKDFKYLDKSQDLILHKGWVLKRDDLKII